MIELKNVYKEYKSSKGVITKALNNINIKLPSSGLIFVLGKSGSGKSTLLNLIGCMDKVTSGNILINDKDISKLSESKLNDYRNSCFGFIFQEHNLIEKFSVYDNLKLPCALKKLKYKKDDYDKILNSVSLDNLGYRRVNELSGGQKTRVSIARALIKNPNVILADEPTGNLDSTNSTQIFEILKNISEDRLVIVVTHDTEYAYKYGDRVIEIEDGNITKDNIVNQINEENKEIKIVKSRLSFVDAIKFSSLNLRKKTIRLIVISIIISVTLTLFGYSYLMNDIDIIKTHSKTMIDNNETKMTLVKKIPGENLSDIHPALNINEEEIKYIKENITDNFEETFRLVLNNEFLGIEKNMDFENPNSEILSNAYYSHSYTESTFIEKSNEKLNSLKLIGKTPSGNNDIVIYKILADYLIVNGVSIVDADSKGNEVIKTWYPKDYNDLVNSNKKILLGNGEYYNSKKYFVYVTGIIDDDLSKFDILKEIDRTKAEHEYKALLKEFENKYMPLLNIRIVNDKFYKDTEIEKNKVLDSSLYDITYTYQNNKYYSGYSTGLMVIPEITVYDGKKLSKINNLKEDEIVLDISLIGKMNGGDKFYSEQLKIYTDKIDKVYEEKVKLREKEVENELKKQEEDPEYIIKEIPEVVKPNDTEIMNDFHKKYIEDFGIAGKNIEMSINKLYGESNNKTYTFKVIGYAYKTNGSDSGKSFVNEKTLDSYMRSNKETYNVIFEENDQTKIEQLLIKYSNEDNFSISTLYSSTINSLKTSVNKLSSLFKKISYGLIIFSIVLLTLYILMSISNSKKEIGILRSLGTKISGIYKIFYLEGLIIGVVSILISSILIYFGTGYINNYISGNLFYSVKPVVFNPSVILYITLVVFIVVSISSVIPLIKISRSKVIDIIYSK